MAWRQLPTLPVQAYVAALPHPSMLPRNLALDLSSAVGLGSTMAVVGVLLPSVARREGLDTMGLAVLAALPFLASLMTLFAGRIGPRSPTRMALMRSLGAMGLLLVLIAPDPLFIALAIFGFWVTFSLGSPLQQRIWATIYPSADRGRMLGYVGTSRSLAGMLALSAIAVVAAAHGFGAIVAVVAVVGAVCSLAVSRMAVPGIEGNYRFSALEFHPLGDRAADAPEHHGRATALRRRLRGGPGAHRHGPRGSIGPGRR